MKIRVFHSDEVESRDAAQDILSQMGSKINPAESAMIVTGNTSYDQQELVDSIKELFPGIAHIGCSSSAQASRDKGFEEDSVLALVFESTKTSFETVVCQNLSKGDLRKTIQKQLAGKDFSDVRLAIMLSESLTVSTDEVLKVLNEEYQDTQFVGGISADNWKFEKTYQYYNGQLFSDACVFLLFHNKDLETAVAIKTGWTPLGDRDRVTKADANVVQEIADMKAVDYIKQKLGPHDNPSGENPLAVFQPDGSFVLRAPLLYNEDGSVAFGGNVPTGSQICITNTTHEDILEASRQSIKQSLEILPNPEVGFFVSCAARKMILGKNIAKEVTYFKETFSEDFGGIYLYGEVGPQGSDHQNMFHNETFVTCLIKE